MPMAFATHAPTQVMFPFTAGDMVSFYVDGATEARNMADVFLVLTVCLEIINDQNRSKAYQKRA